MEERDPCRLARRDSLRNITYERVIRKCVLQQRIRSCMYVSIRTEDTIYSLVILTVLRFDILLFFIFMEESKVLRRLQ